MKKLVMLLTALLSVLCFAGSALAMNYEPVQKVGTFSFFAGGPSKVRCTGFTGTTKSSFTFGSGKYALTIAFVTHGSNGYVYDSFNGMYVEQMQVPVNVQKISLNNATVYRANAHGNAPVYIIEGLLDGLQTQGFCLIAKYRGEKWGAIDISALAQYMPMIWDTD